MIKTARTHRGVTTSIYQMDIFDRVDWHNHAKPHTLEVIRGSVFYEIEGAGGGYLDVGGVAMLPEITRHRFHAAVADTIALTMIEAEQGSEVYGEAGGVLLAQADTQ